MKLTTDGASALFTNLDADTPLKAAFLIRRTGVTIASWSKDAVSSEILSVMSATMIGAVDTIAQTIGCPSPQIVSIEADDCRMLAAHAEAQGLLLVLIAQRSTSESYLRHLSRQILAKIAKDVPSGETRRALIHSRI